MNTKREKTTVLYDGSCALCKAEVCYYRRQDSDGTLCFIDVSDEHTPLPAGIDRVRAMERFHVITASGGILSGASAFIEIWANLPRWRRLATLRKIPIFVLLLERAYKLFLPLRPGFSSLFGKWAKGRLS